MKSTTGIPWVACIAALCAFGNAGCGGHEARTPQLGDTWVLVTHEPTPTGMREERLTCVLADTAGGQGRFESKRDGSPPRSEWRALPLRVHGAARADGPALRRIRVPAGTFECRLSVSTRTERGGRVMRVDEWRAPEIPVPVQRYVRWQGLTDERLARPPGRRSDLILGSSLSVLERAPGR